MTRRGAGRRGISLTGEAGSAEMSMTTSNELRRTDRRIDLVDGDEDGGGCGAARGTELR
jgi:hypothetical protein